MEHDILLDLMQNTLKKKKKAQGQNWQGHPKNYKNYDIFFLKSKNLNAYVLTFKLLN